ncbi:DUF2199 domain-containing protein [Roseibium sp.]|uniref:DUF2199 domain-containing protein n=1 Tax=Roseibium sp. TaxID=1936156 RepID=UPI003B52567F
MTVTIDSSSKRFVFRCPECNEIHEGGPSFATEMPFNAHVIPEDEREERIRLGSDLCIIDDREFYIRATLELPIAECEETFLLGVWVSQSEENFRRYVETFNEDQSGDGSFGWLPVTFPGYKIDDSEVVSLATDVYWGKERPEVVIHPDQEHELATDQIEGLAWDKAVRLTVLMLHSNNAET